MEPTSSFGKALAYMQDHGETLTRFMAIEGAPLDNNVVERALKWFIRQRQNSLFFATEHSAYLASVLTSLIATCLYAGVNALESFDKAQGQRGQRRSRLVPGCHLFFEVCQASPYLFGHA